MKNDPVKTVEIKEAYCRSCKTFAIALNLLDQELVDDPDELGELIERWLSQSDAYLESPEGMAFSNDVDHRISMILCGETDEPD
jgi:hypothetical protein